MAENHGHHHLWRDQANKCGAGDRVQSRRVESRISYEMGFLRENAADERQDRDRSRQIHLQGGVGFASLHYGYDAIPEDWLGALQRREWIEGLCVRAINGHGA